MRTAECDRPWLGLSRSPQTSESGKVQRRCAWKRNPLTGQRVWARPGREEVVVHTYISTLELLPNHAHHLPIHTCMLWLSTVGVCNRLSSAGSRRKLRLGVPPLNRQASGQRGGEQAVEWPDDAGMLRPVTDDAVDLSDHLYTPCHESSLLPDLLSPLDPGVCIVQSGIGSDSLLEPKIRTIGRSPTA